MLRSIFLFVVTLIIAIIGGVASVDYTLRFMDDFFPLTIGEWRAYPHSGTRSADFYARARAAKFKHLALGHPEGLSFYLWQDDQGTPLKATCSYLLTGTLPDSQFFTLYAIGHDKRPRRSQQGRPDILTSYNTLQTAQNTYLFKISPQAKSGNWLSTEGTQNYGLVLTLYNSSIGVMTGLSHPTMPHLTREAAC